MNQKYDNILVCGGLPRSATTFMYSQISNYERVFSSQIKESYLFERSNSFIDFKLNTLKKNRIHLDFTPEYIFSPYALRMLLARRINCFFIIRDYPSYRQSLERYLVINKIRNYFLLHMTEGQFHQAVRFVGDHFLCFQFDEVRQDPEMVMARIRSAFGLEFGRMIRHKDMINASIRREHYVSALLFNHVPGPWKMAKSTLLGII